MGFLSLRPDGCLLVVFFSRLGLLPARPGEERPVSASARRWRRLTTAGRQRAAGRTAVTSSGREVRPWTRTRSVPRGNAPRAVADSPARHAPPCRDEAPAFMGAPAAADPHDASRAPTPSSSGSLSRPSTPTSPAGPAAIRRRAAAIAAVVSTAGAPAAARRLEAASGRAPSSTTATSSPTRTSVEATFMRAHDKLADIFAAGAVPIVFGGDHSVTIPVLQVLAGKLAGKLGIVAFDARLDLELEPRYRAGSQWARAFELGVVEPANFVEIGIREGRAAGPVIGWSPTNSVSASTRGRRSTSSASSPWRRRRSRRRRPGPRRCTCRSTSTSSSPATPSLEAPLSAGLSARELARAVRTLAGGRVAGLDVCGLAPSPRPPGSARPASPSVAALEVLARPRRAAPLTVA